MTRSELKQLIRETIEEGMEFSGKSEAARQAFIKLHAVTEKIEIPQLAQKARIHAGEIIKLIDQDQSERSI